VWARHRLEWVTAVVAAVLGGVYLLMPPMGSDLAAQTARAGFFAAHGYTPIDLRWYAGVDQLGYSLVSQPVMAFLGVRVTGVLALIATSALLAVLFRRTGATRPWLGALVGAVCVAGNLVSGRVTYGLGVLFGVAALLALTSARLRWLAAVPALLASATSPVAGLFLGLAGVALLLSGRILDGLSVAVPAALPLVLTAGLFGDGGWMNISRADAVSTITASLVAAVLVPARPVRIGAVLSALGVLGAALVHTPVGLNAGRLSVMFALPVLAAYAALPWPSRAAAPTPSPRPLPSDLSHSLVASPPAASRPAASLPPASRPAASPPAPSPAAARLPVWRRFRPMPTWGLVVLLLAVCVWQPPVVVSDLRDIGNPTADRAYFTPLLDRLKLETLTGRVEIPSTRDYWEAAYLDDVPLARGWLRQADIDRNPLFFDRVPGAPGTGVALTPDSYRAWLAETAVQFVAVPDAEFTWSGRPEAAMVTAGLPYLTPIWNDEHWRLYSVADPQTIVAPPARLVGHTATTLTFDAPAAADIAVRVRYHRWLTASGGAAVEQTGAWTLVRVPSPGRYTLTS
jgi:hypothetical protein